MVGGNIIGGELSSSTTTTIVTLKAQEAFRLIERENEKETEKHLFENVIRAR